MSRTMTLDKMFNSEATAAIGASNNPYKASHQIINTMIREKYKSTIFPINPTQKHILGLSCCPSLLDMENSVDLLIISVRMSPSSKLLKKLPVGKEFAALLMLTGGQPEPLGFNKFGHLGNTTDINMVGNLFYYEQDEKTTLKIRQWITPGFSSVQS